MNPLLLKLNEKATLRLVEEHLQSFLQIRHLYTIEESDEGEILPLKSQTRSHIKNTSEDRMLRKIAKMEYVNRTTKEYLEMMLNAINSLQEYDRQLIIFKYFYEFDDEELCETVGFSSRKIWSDLRKAKLRLGFILGCECYCD